MPDHVSFEFAPERHLGAHGAAVSARTGGVSPAPFHSLNVGRSVTDRAEHVRENERRVLRVLRLPNRVARLRLEHGDRVLRVEAPGVYGPADGLLTERDDLVLWFTVADCVPLTICAGGWRAHGHCGWRGTASGLAERLVQELVRAAGAEPDRMRAWVGPGIGPCCYPVGPEVASRFPESSLRGPDGRHRRRLDLPGEILRRLLACGLPPSAIARSGVCTSCHPDRFFSHRRDGAPSGRMAALCWPLALAAGAVNSPS